VEPGAAPRLPCAGAARPAVRGLAAVRHHRYAPRGGRWPALARRGPGRRPRLAAPAAGGGQLRGRRLRAEDRQGPALLGARPGHRGRPARAPPPAVGAAAGGRPQVAGLRLGVHLAGRAPHPPGAVSRWFEQHARAAGLPKIRLHDVRHSYATAALAAGVPAKVVSERLGHATIAITMDTYSHVLPGLDELAAGAVARLILGDADQPPPGPIDTPLTTGRKAPSDGEEVEREPLVKGGASGETRTPTSLRTPGPKPGASAIPPRSRTGVPLLGRILASGSSASRSRPGYADREATSRRRPSRT
jgi:Phage integrase family